MSLDEGPAHLPVTARPISEGFTPCSSRTGSRTASSGGHDVVPCPWGSSRDRYARIERQHSGQPVRRRQGQGPCGEEDAGGVDHHRPRGRGRGYPGAGQASPEHRRHLLLAAPAVPCQHHRPGRDDHTAAVPDAARGLHCPRRARDAVRRQVPYRPDHRRTDGVPVRTTRSDERRRRMTTIAPAPGAGSPARATSKDAGTADVAPPVRLRRHPAWVWGGVATVFAGAVAGASLWSAASDANEILAAREPLTRGQIIEQDDLATVRVGLDPAVSSIPASELDAIVGQYAAMDVPAGGLLAAEQVTDQALPAQGQSVVGLSLTGAMVPTQHLQPGDKVR